LNPELCNKADFALTRPPSTRVSVAPDIIAAQDGCRDQIRHGSGKRLVMWKSSDAGSFNEGAGWLLQGTAIAHCK
jgi:hypothetical protein